MIIIKEWIELLKKYWVGIVLFIIVMIIMNLIFGTVCFSTILFGIPCPACGITRAALLLLTGHFRESFQMHPLLLLVILGFIIYPIIKNKLKNYGFFVKIYVIICILIFVSFYIYRMNRYFPNVEPMVYRPDNYFHNILVLIHKCRLQK